MLTTKTTKMLLNRLDRETREHSLRTAAIACDMGERMHLTAKKREELTTAALLHDVGKSAVDQDILLSGRRLGEKEREKIRKHPDYSSKILKQTGKYNRKVRQAVKQHHENWDGSGYGLGLKGNEISFYAQLIHIIDVYDALRSDRAYKAAMTKTECIGYLIENSGRMFNPVLTDRFVEFMQLSDGLFYGDTEVKIA